MSKTTCSNNKHILMDLLIVCGIVITKLGHYYNTSGSSMYLDHYQLPVRRIHFWKGFCLSAWEFRTLRTYCCQHLSRGVISPQSPKPCGTECTKKDPFVLVPDNNTHGIVSLLYKSQGISDKVTFSCWFGEPLLYGILVPLKPIVNAVLLASLPSLSDGQ